MTVIHTNKQMNKSAEQNYIEREEETSGGEPSLEHQGKMWKLDAHIRRIIKKRSIQKWGGNGHYLKVLQYFKCLPSYCNTMQPVSLLQLITSSSGIHSK